MNEISEYKQSDNEKSLVQETTEADLVKEDKSTDKRDSVRKNYDLIADQYSDEFGVELEDFDVITEFESYLDKPATIIDLGGGTGKLTNYFINRGFKSICYDFSEKMKNNALKLFPNLPYILDDIVNIKKHFKDNSTEGIIAMYSLFHIPKEDVKQLFIDINDVLKEKGLFCFTLQMGNDEKFVDEPYLKEKGKNALYMNYFSKDQIYDLLDKSNFDIVFETEKHETGENVIGEDGNDAIYVISKKRGTSDKM